MADKLHSTQAPRPNRLVTLLFSENKQPGTYAYKDNRNKHNLHLVAQKSVRGLFGRGHESKFYEFALNKHVPGLVQESAVEVAGNYNNGCKNNWVHVFSYWWL